MADPDASARVVNPGSVSTAGESTGSPEPWTAIVLAAGKGTRMKSPLPKVLHPLAGRPMLWHVLQALKQAGARRTIVVVGHGADQVKAACDGEGVEFVLQEPQLGTGHAVMQAMPALDGQDGTVLVACGDMPLLQAATFRGLIETYERAGAQAGVLTAHVADAGMYGRIVRDEAGSFSRIVEARDAGPEHESIREINTGTYCFRISALRSALGRIRPDNAQAEYYLTDVPAILAEEGPVITYTVSNPMEWQGINSQADLAQADEALQRRIMTKWAETGIVLVQPSTIRIDADVQLEPGAVIGPMAVLRGSTRVGPGARVWGNQLEDCIVEAGASVGPGVTLERGTVVASGAVIGRREERRASADESYHG